MSLHSLPIKSCLSDPPKFALFYNLNRLYFSASPSPRNLYKMTLVLIRLFGLPILAIYLAETEFLEPLQQSSNQYVLAWRYVRIIFL